ncbi:hypothetical protein KIN20_013438 [Parelaphostrongylus tenuis]|uniref:Uncharacterized protein n=1 Tax=Parelaphostrongylus tenuis TaxID=148309 RepID=A0AAD5N228_PARTN|nr:hypothetical protein KIN20_013438 [Parelaphostrongylus tenuis]
MILSSEHQENMKFVNTLTSSSVEDGVVMDLNDELLKEGRHLCTNYWYTTESLAERLLQRNTYLSGTC